ncbi:MAG: NAD-dependent epimerase/dehydratase family protein [Candidatus Eremiobacteraeota bacterium]|nr:NAD-dependent epimerase/dehydratase family protein [Candidatus Eremiobacteraeota bacterium]
MPADTVFLTGATGFVGSHVFAALRAAGFRVRALARTSPPAFDSTLDDAEIVVGDLLRPGELLRSLRGCRYLIHCAALYSFSPGDRAQMRSVNVEGTASLCEAARDAGVERVVLTSSSVTVGPSDNGRLRTEEDHAADGG